MKQLKNRNDISVALVWTKYQYHILLALLRKLGIDRSSVLLIIFVKAKRQNVSGEGFFKTVYYEREERVSIHGWKGIKKDIFKLVENFHIYPSNLILRNYDSIIGRILLSVYAGSSVYLMEEGIGSYEKRDIFGYPHGLKDKIRNILLRLYFSKNLLKVLAVNKNNVRKVGLFSNVDPWLPVPYIEIQLMKEDSTGNEEELYMDKDMKKYSVLILEQPLWEAWHTVISDEGLISMYRKLISFILEHVENSEKLIALKMHPSSDKKRVENILYKAGVKDKITILDTTCNVEEMIFLNQLDSIKTIIGFNSSALYLAKALLKGKDIEIIAFSTPQLYLDYNESYEILSKMGINHVRSK